MPEFSDIATPITNRLDSYGNVCLVYQIQTMITLAIDTCDRRGSIALRENGDCLAVKAASTSDEYSSWLLPAVEGLLAANAKRQVDLGLLAVATGPGSFTGVRIGICAVKAWAEVYGTRVVGVSRLEALARSMARDGWVAPTFDAHRGQIFAGLYRRYPGQSDRVEEDLVIAPEDFLALVERKVAGAAVQWPSLDPGLIRAVPVWRRHEARGSKLWECKPELANAIGEVAEEKAIRDEFADILELDANYVRRSDAEILWKGPAHRAG
jgi:tRNA threonylcarbamoyladenosine biosynthesis protein TsaB